VTGNRKSWIGYISTRTIKFAGQCPPALAANKDGDLAVGEDLHGLAAEHNRSKPAAAMRGHTDQVATFVLRGVNDCLIGLVVLHIHDVAGDAFFQGHALDLIEAFVGESFELRLITPLFRRLFELARSKLKSRTGETTVMLVTFAPVVFASDIPCSTAFRDNSEPSVGMRICLYMTLLLQAFPRAQPKISQRRGETKG
jgi:hypothetical protein